MSLAINLLMFVLVLVCLLLGLLILIQLPKKEAGLGQAFGGAATEALFGAGSGTALTKLTKYSAGAFLILCVLLAWMNAQLARSRNLGVERALKAASAPAVLPQTPAATVGGEPAPLVLTPEAFPVEPAPVPAADPTSPEPVTPAPTPDP